MTEFAKARKTITSRGTAFLEASAGTVAGGNGDVEEMLGEACRDMGDWACVFAALGAWDSANADINAAIEHIVAAAKTYCNERGA